MHFYYLNLTIPQTFESIMYIIDVIIGGLGVCKKITLGQGGGPEKMS